ncbi:hypothetical protein HBB16_15375 [Pseudonocardia sp. MCCB 268]|nr:hypothetical protein [Pseudonocardia cytotoxica]
MDSEVRHRLPGRVRYGGGSSSRWPTTSRTSRAARCSPGPLPRIGVKDLGDANTVAGQYKLDTFRGTPSATLRMATGSDVDIAGAHPYWAYPFSDVAVVHNGQLTNYHQWRRRLERSGHRFQSECDSRIIAVYLAERLADGLSLPRRR